MVLVGRLGSSSRSNTSLCSIRWGGECRRYINDEFLLLIGKIRDRSYYINLWLFDASRLGCRRRWGRWRWRVVWYVSWLFRNSQLSLDLHKSKRRGAAQNVKVPARGSCRAFWVGSEAKQPGKGSFDFVQGIAVSSSKRNLGQVYDIVVFERSELSADDTKVNDRFSSDSLCTIETPLAARTSLCNFQRQTPARRSLFASPDRLALPRPDSDHLSTRAVSFLCCPRWVPLDAPH